MIRQTCTPGTCSDDSVKMSYMLSHMQHDFDNCVSTCCILVPGSIQTHSNSPTTQSICTNMSTSAVHFRAAEAMIHRTQQHKASRQCQNFMAILSNVYRVLILSRQTTISGDNCPIVPPHSALHTTLCQHGFNSKGLPRCHD